MKFLQLFTPRSLYAFGALAVGVTGLAKGIQFPPAPVRPASAPPAALWQDEVPTTRFGLDIYRDIQVRPLEKIVSLEWRYTSVAPPSPVVVKAQNSEIYVTRFWPTRVALLDDFQVCVAGRTVTGRAVLERWTFGNQSALGTPAPSAIQTFPTGGGPPHTTWTLPPRGAVDEIFVNPSNAPTGDIKGILPSLHSSSTVFVYYAGTSELYAVDLVSHVQTLKASPLVTGQALHVPALAGAYDSHWSVDYVGQGHCYFFASLSPISPTAPVETLVCIDANRDGEIDSSRLLSASAWQSEGWGNPANILGPN